VLRYGISQRRLDLQSLFSMLQVEMFIGPWSSTSSVSSTLVTTVDYYPYINRVRSLIDICGDDDADVVVGLTLRTSSVKLIHRASLSREQLTSSRRLKRDQRESHHP